jgi:hypothetical protein
MARYEHLPIYKKAMDLTIYFEKIVRTLASTINTRWRANGRTRAGKSRD